jgi:hypothetical protein
MIDTTGESLNVETLVVFLIGAFPVVDPKRTKHGIAKFS